MVSLTEVEGLRRVYLRVRSQILFQMVGFEVPVGH